MTFTRNKQPRDPAIERGAEIWGSAPDSFFKKLEEGGPVNTHRRLTHTELEELFEHLFEESERRELQRGSED